MCNKELEGKRALWFEGRRREDANIPEIRLERTENRNEDGALGPVSDVIESVGRAAKAAENALLMKPSSCKDRVGCEAEGAKRNSADPQITDESARVEHEVPRRLFSRGGTPVGKTTR